MKRDKGLAHSALVALVAIATIALSSALSGCGADDSAPPATSSANSSSLSSASPGMAANDALQQGTSTSSVTSPAAFVADASAPFAADAAAASDPVAQTMQANLAADNQQIAPVMRYAPGDSKSSN